MDIETAKKIMDKYNEAVKLPYKSKKVNKNRARPIPKHFINTTIKLADFFTDCQKRKLNNQLAQRVPESEIPLILNSANEPPEPYRGDEIGAFTLQELNSIKQINQKYDTSTEQGQKKAFADYPESVKRKVVARERTKLDPAYTSYKASKHLDFFPLENVISLSKSERENIKNINRTYNINTVEGIEEAFAQYPKRIKNFITAPIWERGGHQDTTPIIKTRQGDY